MLLTSFSLLATLLAPLGWASLGADSGTSESKPAASSGALGRASSSRFAIRATRIHVDAGAVYENALLVIEDGKIQAVGETIEIEDGLRVLEHDGDLSAGLIALRDFSGLGGENADSTRTHLPEARLVHAFDPDHSDFERLRAAGITSIVLGAPGSHLNPGQSAVVKTAGRVVLSDSAHLLLSLSRSALSMRRSPSSFGSAVTELSERLTAGEGAFGRVKAGELPVLIAAEARHEMVRALEFAEQHGLRGALIGVPLAGEFAERIRGSGLAVVLSAFDPGASGRSLRAVRSLAEAGVPFGYALDAPGRHPVSLRMAAAAAVREGVDPAQALDALTASAATIAGVEGRVGRLAPGLDADFCLWSGAPTDLTSRLMAVYIDGQRVFASEPSDDRGGRQ